MALSSGTRLGHYEIRAAIGAGGMGEVYRATDTRLDRTVAIKVLPRTLSDDAEFRARFARETRTISTLDHPHICALYDVGEADETSYLVMQYLDGETLAARLARGALPVDQALRCGAEIAAALDHAHRHGIVHRDLKPGNIMLTKSGARLLDFGLAKPIAHGAAAESTRLDSPLTSQGLVVGTVPYMAPEQIEGREADARTDVFAFGAVLHEMLTGARAFTASTVASLAGAILRDEPLPPSRLVPGVPPALDHVVRRCLAKDPDERWASAHDLLIELTWIREGGSGVSAPIAPSRVKRERRVWTLVVLAVVLGATAAIAWLMRAPAGVPRVPARFVLAPPAKTTWLPWGIPSVSPDGQHVVMTATEADGRVTLWTRRIDGVVFRRIEGVTNVPDARPIWSPDSRWIVFAEGQTLKRAEAGGGPPQVICQLERPEEFGGAAMNRDGIVLLGSTKGPVRRVLASGGTPEPAAALDTAHGEVSQVDPWFLPDGKRYLIVSRTSSRSKVMVGALDSNTRTEVLANAWSPAYVPPGLILFTRDGRVMVQRFDAARLRAEGDAQAVDPQLHPETAFPSNAGTLICRAQLGGYVRRNGEITAGNSRLAWFDRRGRELDAITPLGGYFNPRLAPDERTIAVEQFDNENAGDLWTIDLRRKLGTRVTFDPRRDSDPVWSPHGDRLAWSRTPPDSTTWSLSRDDTQGEILAQPARGADPVVLTRGQTDELGPFVADWSPDGRYLAIQRLTVLGHARIEFLPVDGGDPVRWASSGASEGGPRFAPGGRWVAYISAESGQVEVYVRPFAAAGEKIRVSSSGGTQPDWRGDGRELYFVAPDRTLMAVPVQPVRDRLEFGTPVPLFKAPIASPWGRNHYQPASDGQRFLINVLDPTQSAGSPDLVVMLDWARAMYDELGKAAGSAQ
jgi:Tol biopolymer transport system component